MVLESDSMVLASVREMKGSDTWKTRWLAGQARSRGAARNGDFTRVCPRGGAGEGIFMRL